MLAAWAEADWRRRALGAERSCLFRVGPTGVAWSRMGKRTTLPWGKPAMRGRLGQAGE